MKNKRRFKIGDIVEIKAFTYAKYDESFDEQIIKNERKLFVKVFQKPKIGQIVGIGKIYLGKYIPGNIGSPHLCYEDADPPSLKISKQIYLWKVILGVMNKPMLVADEDVISTLKKSTFELPLLYSEQPEWSEKWRKEQRNIMKDHPRNEKGRWMKLK